MLVKKGCKRGITRGYKLARELARQAVHEEFLELLRKKFVELVATHFPKLERFAKKQASGIEDADRLLDLIMNVSAVKNAEDVIDYLIALGEEEPITP
jgi:glutamate/tyrosine decarboxylase-like PLP-dependent enzyme